MTSNHMKKNVQHHLSTENYKLKQQCYTQFSSVAQSCPSLCKCYTTAYLLEQLKPQILPRMWVSSNADSLQPLWKTVWQFLIKLNILLSYDPAVMLLGIYTKELKTYIHRETYTQMFIPALFIVAKTQRQQRCPSRWVDQINFGTHIQWNIINN